MTITDLPDFTERYQEDPDRPNWAQGPWTDEPDKVVWVDEATGLDCMARRGGGGAWCGYVGVKEAHPWHGKGYSDCLTGCGDEWCYEHSIGVRLTIHGGITFADSCNDDGEAATSVCHLSDDGRPVWWFGFNTNHLGDRSPSDATRGRYHGEHNTYKDLRYAVAETRSLALQLSEATA